MAFQYGERTQMTFFPPAIEDYVAPDAPVRAYDAFVNTLNLAAVGINPDGNQAGRPAYEPAAMLKLLLYGVSYGVRSSRKLERECHYNRSFIWLMGGLRPDHKTIAEFRRHYHRALAQVLKQCARMCLRMGLVDGNALFVDGTRLRADANLQNHWTKKKLQETLAALDRSIEQTLEQCETEDQAQAQERSWVELPQDLAQQQQLKAKLEQVLAELQATEAPHRNRTDPDAVIVKSRQGTHVGYTGEIVTDGLNGLIVNADVVSANNDKNQMQEQITRAEAVLEQPCQIACADAGFSDSADLAPLDARGLEVIVPSDDQASERPPQEFDKSQFSYDQMSDSFLCPRGERLVYSSTEKARRRRYYRAGKVCRQCPHFGWCTKDKINGRKLTRGPFEELRQKLDQQYVSSRGRAIYARRKEVTEPIFGHFKRNLGAGQFLLRGLSKVRAEFALLATAYNLRRLISLRGVMGLQEAWAG